MMFRWQAEGRWCWYIYSNTRYSYTGTWHVAHGGNIRTFLTALFDGSIQQYPLKQGVHI